MATEQKESVYIILSKLIKLKFHKELKDSGIELNQIFSSKNLLTEKEHYILVVNDTAIRFVTTNDLCAKNVKIIMS